MSNETQTYEFEIIVPEVTHEEKQEDGTYNTVIDREYVRFTKSGLRTKPTRTELLDEYQGKLIEAGITMGSIGEIVVNIRDFFGR